MLPWNALRLVTPNSSRYMLARYESVGAAALSKANAPAACGAAMDVPLSV